MDLSLVIVSYNDRERLALCLKSLYMHLDGCEFEVWVVDNASTDGAPQMVKAAYPQAHLLCNSKNVGFPTANNQALGQCRGEYILLLNQDAELRDHAVQEMVAIMRQNPALGVLGPRLETKTGTVQVSFGPFMKLGSYLETVLLPSGVLAHLQAKRIRETFSRPGIVPVDWVMGACLMIRASVVNEIGPMDPNYFLFGEEIDWCYRTKQAGHAVCIAPQTRVVHHGGTAATRRMDKRLFDTHASKLYFFGKFYGQQVLLFRSIMVGECLFKLALYGTAFLFSHSQSHRQHITGYRNLLKYLVLEKRTTPFIDSGRYGWRSA